jgi:hypothetical protein
MKTKSSSQREKKPTLLEDGEDAPVTRFLKGRFVETEG